MCLCRDPLCTTTGRTVLLAELNRRSGLRRAVKRVCGWRGDGRRGAVLRAAGPYQSLPVAEFRDRPMRQSTRWQHRLIRRRESRLRSLERSEGSGMRLLTRFIAQARLHRGAPTAVASGSIAPAVGVAM